VPETILAFDTAAAACSAVLWRGGDIAAREWAAMARGHAEALVPMIERVMRGVAYADLSAIAVTVGPGAFTGLRIALATARGLGLATGVPTIGVTSFDVAARMAAGAWEAAGGVLAVALETKRADLYLQAFDADASPLTLAASVPVDGVASWLPAGARRLAVAGDAAARLIAALPHGVDASPVAGTALPDATAVAALAAARLAAAPPRRPPPPLRPLYLRPPDVTLPRTGGRGHP
jgi:tRNA threonylcarbamoyladenosine biosynthesis protein TsaB